MKKKQKKQWRNAKKSRRTKTEIDGKHITKNQTQKQKWRKKRSGDKKTKVEDQQLKTNNNQTKKKEVE